jgi:hypothetical protein
MVSKDAYSHLGLKAPETPEEAQISIFEEEFSQ